MLDTRSDRLMTIRKSFGSTREIFAITALGSKFYILTSAADVTEAYRNSTTLSFDQFSMALMRVCGCSDVCITAMYRPLPKDKKGFPNPQAKPLAKLAREIHIQELYPGDGLDIFDSIFAEFLLQNLQLGRMATCLGSRYSVQSTDSEVTLPLSLWCSDIFIRGGQTAYFGDRLAQIDPEMTWAFLDFDELSWQVHYQYPKVLSRKMRNARDRVVAALDTYFKLPASERLGGVRFVHHMETEMRDLGIDNYGVATMMMILYWGIMSNPRRAAFWMLAYILHTPGLLQAIREETRPAFSSARHQINVHYLGENCPKLEGVWNETIRMSSYSASVRYVTEDTRVGDKMLRKGNRVMIPYRQLHFNEEIFGTDVHNFNPDRFLHDASLLRKSTWRPFGGGQTMCPGRFVAKNAVITFVALLFYRYDVELVGDQAFPRAELRKPVLGIMTSKDGDDLLVRFKARTAA